MSKMSFHSWAEPPGLYTKQRTTEVKLPLRAIWMESEELVMYSLHCKSRRPCMYKIYPKNAVLLLQMNVRTNVHVVYTWYRAHHAMKLQETLCNENSKFWHATIVYSKQRELSTQTTLKWCRCACDTVRFVWRDESHSMSWHDQTAIIF